MSDEGTEAINRIEPSYNQAEIQCLVISINSNIKELLAMKLLPEFELYLLKTYFELNTKVKWFEV